MYKKQSKLKKKLLKIWRKIRRHPNELRANHNSNASGQHDLDDMIIRFPRRTLFYFKFEHFLSITFSIVITVSLIIFQVSYTELLSKYTSLLVQWLRLGGILHILSAICKIYIIRKLLLITSDEQIIIRRLMLLVRSNIFHYNTILAYLSFSYYIFGISKLASTPVCDDFTSKVHRLAYVTVCGFVMRLMNILIRFILEYYFLLKSVQYDGIIDKGAKQIDIDKVLKIKLEKNNFNHVVRNVESDFYTCCSICLEEFVKGEWVRVMPCNKNHVFHLRCIDKWLKMQSSCPYCNSSLYRSLNKKEQ